jgi:uncharacterized cupin superfamily protein
MKRVTVNCLAQKRGKTRTVTVEGYEIEPGWVVHRAIGLGSPESRSWAVTHAESGRALLQHSPSRAHAVKTFHEYKRNGTVARMLREIGEDYEIEPGWVVTSAAGALGGWTVKHVATGHAMFGGQPTREIATWLFNELKAEGYITRRLKRLKEDA